MQRKKWDKKKKETLWRNLSTEGLDKINKGLTNRRGKFIYIVEYDLYELLPKQMPNIITWVDRED